MRITDGIIYLAQPLFGRTLLRGRFVVLTTWLDFAFTERLTAAEMGLPADSVTPIAPRLLIPLSNVLGIVAEAESDEPRPL